MEPLVTLNLSKVSHTGNDTCLDRVTPRAGPPDPKQTGVAQEPKCQSAISEDKQIGIAYIKITQSARNSNKSISISLIATSARISNRGCDDDIDR